MPTGMLSTLLLENPSLLFALSDVSPSDALEAFGDITSIGNRLVEGTNCPSVQFGNEGDPQMVQVCIDPATHLIRQFVFKIKSTEFPTAGAASILVNYTTMGPQPYFSPQHFAWTPPAGATDVLEAAGSESKQNAF